MDLGKFYFLTDDYFIDFPDENLMRNSEKINGEIHDRPCFYSFLDNKTNVYWMIPFSSKVLKYRKIYNDKITRYGKCDTIIFGEILGHAKAFLIQNMCPVIPKYIQNEYIDKNSNTPVKVNGIFDKEIISKAKKVLSLQRKGNKLIFPDVLTIEKALIIDIEINEAQEQVASGINITHNSQ